MESIRERQRKFEALIHKTEGRIEALKTEYNLFFAGEVKVPPEKERINIEKVIRDIQSKDLRSGKLDFLLQNLSSRFYLYNNMWLKKLNQLELGTLKRPSKTPKYEKKAPAKDVSKNSTVSLNNEDSFESFYNEYDNMVKGSKGKGKSKDNLINQIKLKMISENIIDAKITLTIDRGKVKIKIKK
ncbi:MAG: hypothetical protein KAR14_09860 [Candidatus Aminicenantes bacterium]|nr:hypothetical protein [Candidatus Aminicenantes bacterium]